MEQHGIRGQAWRIDAVCDLREMFLCREETSVQTPKSRSNLNRLSGIQVNFSLLYSIFNFWETCNILPCEVSPSQVMVRRIRETASLLVIVSSLSQEQAGSLGLNPATATKRIPTSQRRVVSSTKDFVAFQQSTSEQTFNGHVLKHDGARYCLAC